MKKVVLFIGILSLAVSGASATDAQTLLQENGCMGCHNIRGKKSAPAFMGVARRNLRFKGVNAKVNIINSIKNGSRGEYRNFQGTQMPPYSNLSESDLNTIADYILSLENQRGGYGKGNGRGNRGEMMR